MNSGISNLVSAGVAFVVMFFTLTLAQASSLNLTNPGFDLPATGKITHGYDLSSSNTVDVPGWMNTGSTYIDTGVESSPPGRFGGWAAYSRAGDDGGYQITTNQIVPGVTYVLTFWAARGGGSGTSTNQVNIVGATATDAPYSGVSILATTNTTSASSTWVQYSVRYTAAAADAGKYIGVSFQNVTPSSSNWGEWDQFDLMVGLSITTQPQSVNALSGDPVSLLVVAANNTGTINYQWRHGPVGGPYTNLVDGGTVSGATSNVLSISSLNTATDLGGYVVVVQDSLTNETSMEADITAVSSLTVANPGFEDGVYVKIQTGFDNPTNDVPGWRNANVPTATNQSVVFYTDTGIEPGGRSDGAFEGYTKSGEGGAYQILPYQMQAGTVLSLSWWAHANRNNNNGAQVVSLISGTNAAEPFADCTVLTTLSNSVAGGSSPTFALYTLTYTNQPTDAGKRLGIYINAANNGTTTWISFDDFRITTGSVVITNLYFTSTPPMLRYGAPGVTYQAQVMADYSNGTISNDVTAAAQYTIGDSDVATVNSVGGVTVVGISQGPTTLTASYNGMTANQPVTLLMPTALRISPIVPFYPPPYVGGPTVSAKVYADFGTTYTNVDVDGYNDPLGYGDGTVASQWSSDNGSIFTVSGGSISPVSQGSANLSVVFYPLTASRSVTVEGSSPLYQLLQNASFEEPNAGKINYGYDPSGTNIIDVPNWMDAGTNYLDSGIEPKNPQSGTYAAYCRGGDSGAYQIANYQVTNGDTFILTWWGEHTGGNTGATTQMVSLVTAPGTATPYADVLTVASNNDVLPGTGTSPSGYANYMLIYQATAADAGKHIGVYFNSANPAQNNFAAWDNFDLAAMPLSSAPNAPVGVTASVMGTQVTLGWAATGGAESYNVKRGDSSGSEATIANTSSTTYVDSGLAAGTTYYYTVSAVNGFGESTNSAEVLATTEVATAPNPTIQFSGSELQLNWSSGTLQETTNLATGPWVPVPGATPPSYTVTNHVAQPQMFYRVSVP